MTRVALVLCLVALGCVPARRSLALDSEGGADDSVDGGFPLEKQTATCRDWRARTEKDGPQTVTVKINANTNDEPVFRTYDVYCDMTTAGGGWMLYATRSSRTDGQNWIDQVGIGNDVTDPNVDADNVSAYPFHGSRVVITEVAYELDDYRYRLVFSREGNTDPWFTYLEGSLARPARFRDPPPDAGIDASGIYLPPPLTCLTGVPPSTRGPQLTLLCANFADPDIFESTGLVFDPNDRLKPCWWARRDFVGAARCLPQAKPPAGAKARVWVR